MFLGKRRKTPKINRTHFQAVKPILIGLQIMGMFCYTLREDHGSIRRKLNKFLLIWSACLQTLFLSVIIYVTYTADFDGSSIGSLVYFIAFRLHHFTNVLFVVLFSCKSSMLSKIFVKIAELDKYITGIEEKVKPKIAKCSFSYGRLYANPFLILMLLISLGTFMTLMSHWKASYSGTLKINETLLPIVGIQSISLIFILLLHQLFFKLLAINLERSLFCVAPTWSFEKYLGMSDNAVSLQPIKTLADSQDIKTAWERDQAERKLITFQPVNAEMNELQVLADVARKVGYYCSPVPST
ncbi:hypothetical protein SK128_018874, partial [Halocaridina rubra]